MFEYLIASYDPETCQVHVKIKPDTYSSQTWQEIGLDWLGKDRWELVSSIPIGSFRNTNFLQLIFKRVLHS